MISGHDYRTKMLLPDCYLHVATVHAMLPQHGGGIGKADYLGEIAGMVAPA